MSNNVIKISKNTDDILKDILGENISIKKFFIVYIEDENQYNVYKNNVTDSEVICGCDITKFSTLRGLFDEI